MRISELRVAADPERWSQAGFDLADATVRAGTVAVRLAAGGPAGLQGWSLAHTGETDWDGLNTDLGDEPPERLGSEHPNSVVSIDHLVIFTGSPQRTIERFEVNGVRCRRVREVGPPGKQLRQAFFRFGEVIAEVVEVPADQAGADGAARFWGITFVACDLARAARVLGEDLGSARDAVQADRRIATVRESAGLGIPVALISPDRRRG